MEHKCEQMPEGVGIVFDYRIYNSWVAYGKVKGSGSSSFFPNLNFCPFCSEELEVVDYRMNEAEKSLVDALLSGSYKQASGKLMRREGFCCLGVACDVIRTGEWIDGAFVCQFNGLPYDKCLPPSVKEKLNWEFSSGLLTNEAVIKVEFQSLVQANDAGVNFKTIASWIIKGYVKHKENKNERI